MIARLAYAAALLHRGNGIATELGLRGVARLRFLRAWYAAACGVRG